MFVIILIFSLREEKIYYVSGSESSWGKLTNNHFGKTILESVHKFSTLSILKLSNYKICRKKLKYITVQKISKPKKNFYEPFFKTALQNVWYISLSLARPLTFINIIHIETGRLKVSFSTESVALKRLKIPKTISIKNIATRQE